MQGTSFSSHGLGSYVGQRRHGLIEGIGTYYFDTGTTYQGEFKDGMFHGKGTLFFTNGGRYDATWAFGKEVIGSYQFADGLKFEPNDDPLTGWRYCNRVWDRRFYPEIVNGLRPANLSMMSPLCNKKGKPLRYIPKNCFDPGNGFYDPKSRTIYKYKEEEKSGKRQKGERKDSFIRSVTSSEHGWITENCRKGHDEYVGSLRVNDYENISQYIHKSGEKAMRKLGSFLEDKLSSKNERSHSHLPLMDYSGSDLSLPMRRSSLPKSKREEVPSSKKSVTWSVDKLP